MFIYNIYIYIYTYIKYIWYLLFSTPEESSQHIIKGKPLTNKMYKIKYNKAVITNITCSSLSKT